MMRTMYTVTYLLATVATVFGTAPVSQRDGDITFPKANEYKDTNWYLFPPYFEPGNYLNVTQSSRQLHASLWCPWMCEYGPHNQLSLPHQWRQDVWSLGRLWLSGLWLLGVSRVTSWEVCEYQHSAAMASQFCDASNSHLRLLERPGNPLHGSSNKEEVNGSLVLI